MAGKPIRDTQGLGISSQSDYKEEAADFLQYLHSEERVDALWDQVRQLPADTTWDGSAIDNPTVKQIWDEWMHGDSIPYVSNLMPVLFWTDAMFVNSQKIISGDYNGEQAGANAEEVSGKWREQNPDFVAELRDLAEGPQAVEIRSLATLRRAAMWGGGCIGARIAEGRVALVTGAGQGLGQAIAREYAAEGATVALLERNPDTLEKVRAELEGNARRVLAYPLDVTDYDAYGSAVRDVVEKAGGVDVLVSNAAISRYATILEDTLEDWREQIAVNLEAYYMGAKLVAPHMVEQGFGRIVSIASIQGFISTGEVGPYNAAKGGIVALTKSLAVELAPYNILANAIAPGFMRTPMSVIDGVDETQTDEFNTWYVDKRKVPMARTGYPEDVAGTAVFLASDYCRYMTGQLLVVDGGLTSTI